MCFKLMYVDAKGRCPDTKKQFEERGVIIDTHGRAGVGIILHSSGATSSASAAPELLLSFFTTVVGWTSLSSSISTVSRSTSVCVWNRALSDQMVLTTFGKMLHRSQISRLQVAYGKSSFGNFLNITRHWDCSPVEL